MALQYDSNTGAELFGVAFDFLTSTNGAYGWGGSLGVYKVWSMNEGESKCAGCHRTSF